MSTVLVLNSDYTPLNVTSVQRGFVLVTKGKAEVLRSDENPIVTGYKTFIRPVIIRLLKYIRHRTRLNKPNRSRIYKRDGYECVYCGSKKNLTLDHVIPKSRGGIMNGQTWLLVVQSVIEIRTTKLLMRQRCP